MINRSLRLLAVIFISVLLLSSCNSKEKEERADKLAKGTGVLRELNKLESEGKAATTKPVGRLDQLADKEEEKLIDAESLLRKRVPRVSPSPEPASETPEPTPIKLETPRATVKPTATPLPTTRPTLETAE